jgi:hypothetical protein
MIVNFWTRVGSIVMHGDVAIALLRGAGHSGTVPGAILAADLPAALAQLRHFLDALPAPPPAAPSPGREADEEEAEPPVPLRTRAVPLIDMIETAIARDSDLMWERG